MKLTSLKMERHVTSNNPPDNNEEWSDAQRNLDARANCYTHSQVHLVAKSDDYSSNVLRSVSNNGDQDQTDECFADICAFDNVVDASDQVIGTDGNQNRYNDKNRGSSNWAQSGLFGLLAFGGDWVLGVEKVAVRTKLEHEIEGV